jgi:hypothetical protein
MRMQDGLPAPRASINKSGSAQDTIMVAFEYMRKIAACRTKPILVFLLAFSHHVYLGESLRTQVYNIASENPRVGQESWGEKRGNASRMEVVGRGSLSSILNLALDKSIIRRQPRFRPAPLLVHPHPNRRFRRVHRVLLLSAVHFSERIPAAAMITKPTMRMQDRFAALLTLPNQLGATPNAKMLSLLRERRITTLWTNSIFVGRHLSGQIRIWLRGVGVTTRAARSTSLPARCLDAFSGVLAASHQSSRCSEVSQ